jgi:hypothetical protein
VPCFSYTLVECPICTKGVQSTKRRRVDRETVLDTLFLIQPTATCLCFNRQKVDPSVYTYSGSLTQVDGPVTQVIDGGVQGVLAGMSITPSRMGTFTDGFCRPVDMGDDNDTIPRSHGLASENRAFSAFQCRKNSQSLELGDYPNGCQTILDIIKRMNENYNYLAIQKLCVDKNKRTFLISVKGSGSRFCIYKKGTHKNNRLYFSVDVNRARIEARCFDPDCKREHAETPTVELALNLMETSEVTTQFGLKQVHVQQLK